MRAHLLVAALLLCPACSPREQAAADAGGSLAADTIMRGQDVLDPDVLSLDSLSSDALNPDTLNPDTLNPDAIGTTPDSEADAQLLPDGAAPGLQDVWLDSLGGLDSGADGAQDGGVADTFIYPQATPNSAPTVKVHPWPPPCKNPKFIGPPNNQPSCWELPEHWCQTGGIDYVMMAPACSADGTQCCMLNDPTCLPCGWVNCFGYCSFGDPGAPDYPQCPPQCKDQPSPWTGQADDLWGSPNCQILSKILTRHNYNGKENVKNCGICGTDVYCKWKKP